MNGDGLAPVSVAARKHVLHNNNIQRHAIAIYTHTSTHVDS